MTKRKIITQQNIDRIYLIELGIFIGLAIGFLLTNILYITNFGNTATNNGLQKIDNSKDCDIGLLESAGDYIQTNNYFEDRNCAIKDCLAFNKFQEQLNSTMRCMV